MQVNKIQSCTSFGYNQEVNNTLINLLDNQKKNKAYYTFMKSLCVSTNKAENELREAEKKKKPYLQQMLIASFLPAKILVTTMLNALFPEMDYRDKEIESYEDEIIQNNLLETQPNNWRNSLLATLIEDRNEEKAQAIADTLSNIMHRVFPDTKFDFSNLTGAISQQYREQTETEEKSDETDNDKIKLGKTKVIEYVPTPMSEQGFASLGGMKELKETLNDKIVGVLKDPAQAKLDNIEYGKKIPKGLLLYGPPGTGKTTVVEHLSTEAGVPLLKLETGKLKTSWAHESARNIDAAFEYAESIATPEKPVLLMIDDADSMFTKRNDHSPAFETEDITTFLNRIQRAPEHNVMVVATTNKYDIMDDAIRSRFDEQIYVGLPDQEARVSILKLFLNQRTKGHTLANNDAELEKVAQKMEKFAIREILGMTNRASMLALKDGRRDITAADFEKIIAESQNLKVKEELYKTNATRKPIGF